MTQIIPRWEFRVFIEDIDDVNKKIRALSEVEKTSESSEVYLISSTQNEINIKIRDNLLDIKKLTMQKSDLEQWQPILKNSFPMKSDVIKNNIFPLLNADIPELKRDEYTLEQFLDELVIRHRDLIIVQVSKKRYSFIINECMVEIADVLINNTPVSTACIESTEIDKILETKKMVTMEDYENVNYIKAIKRVIGMEPK